MSKQAPEYYLVAGGNTSTGEYRFIDVDVTNGQRIEILARCDYYQWAGHDMVTGPQSCSVKVGDRVIPNPLGNRPGEFVMVWRDNQWLQIQTGSGADQVTQGFRIVSAKVVKE